MNFILPVTFAFLGLFNYPSEYEAHQACHEWKWEAHREQLYVGPHTDHQRYPIRECIRSND